MIPNRKPVAIYYYLHCKILSSCEKKMTVTMPLKCIEKRESCPRNSIFPVKRYRRN